MSTTLNLDGQTLTLPTANDTAWDTNLNNTITAIVDKANDLVDDLASAVTLTGTQTLTNKTLTSPTINGATLSGTLAGSPNFSGSPTVGGVAVVTTSATQALTNKTLASATANAASAGVVRLANNSDVVSWRNAANNADLDLKVDSSNNLEFNGVDIVTVSGTQTLSNKTFAAPTFTALGSAAASWAKDGGNTAPRYWKDALGQVHIMGGLTATGAASLTCFAAGTIPVGSRPLGFRVGSCTYFDDSAGTFVGASISAAADGSMTIQASVSVEGDDTVQFYITYPAEQ